jgi:hypothetical protein
MERQIFGRRHATEPGLAPLMELGFATVQQIPFLAVWQARNSLLFLSMWRKLAALLQLSGPAYGPRRRPVTRQDQLVYGRQMWCWV